MYGKAGLTEFHTARADRPRASAHSAKKCAWLLDAEVDGAYPQRWLGRVKVTTRDGRTLRGAIDEPKGDPGNTLSRAELEDKFRRLLAFSGARSADQAGVLIDKCWRLRQLTDLSELA